MSPHPPDTHTHTHTQTEKISANSAKLLQTAAISPSFAPLSICQQKVAEAAIKVQQETKGDVRRDSSKKAQTAMGGIPQGLSNRGGMILTTSVTLEALMESPVQLYDCKKLS